MQPSVASHAAVASLSAFIASGATCFALGGLPIPFSSLDAHAQTAPPAGTRQIELFKTTMEDVLGRVVSVRRTERDPGSGSAPHRHPGSHTIGYILEGVYEFKLNDGPVQKLGPGDTFYEAPNSLHAISRNGDPKTTVKYLVIQVSDTTKPATVNEP
jgi:quercetin dioxygenase-like cupin family protein